MTSLDELLDRLRQRTEQDPGPIEAQVLKRLSSEEHGSFRAIIALPGFTPAAMATGLLMGIVGATAMPPDAAAPTGFPELAAFAPNSPLLISSNLGQIK